MLPTMFVVWMCKQDGYVVVLWGKKACCMATTIFVVTWLDKGVMTRKIQNHGCRYSVDSILSYLALESAMEWACHIESHLWTEEETFERTTLKQWVTPTGLQSLCLTV
ncbi:unnamed protein product [Lepidochelys olivacea]